MESDRRGQSHPFRDGLLIESSKDELIMEAMQPAP